MGQFVWPVPGHTTVSSGFGPRSAVKTSGGYSSTDHKGIDIAAPNGTGIVAARGGSIVYIGYSKARGNYLKIRHDETYSTLYQHCAKILLRSGSNVSAGDKIALVGQTGNVSGPHLHFEIQKGGTPVDPLNYLRAGDTLANFTGGAITSAYSGAASSEYLSEVPETEVIHVPQTEKVYTIYQDDTPYKQVDRYQVVWKPFGSSAKDITARVGDLTLTDDSAAVCTELSFEVLGSYTDRYLAPLGIRPGDLVSVSNLSSNDCLFVGQVQSVSGSYSDKMEVLCADQGRLLTCNSVIMQFANVPAETAISHTANRVGIYSVSCPKLISSVYGIEKGSASGIIQKILETVTAENGVTYFPRVMGNTLVIKSFAKDCITPYYRQEKNVQSFPVLGEVLSASVSLDISDLRNKIVVYSEADSSVSVQAEDSNRDSIAHYGERVEIVTFSDKDTVSAGSKAKTELSRLDRVAEELTLAAYGSDRVVAGVRLKIDLPEISGEFHVTAVTHELGTPHRMTMTLRRAET